MRNLTDLTVESIGIVGFIHTHYTQWLRLRFIRQIHQTDKCCSVEPASYNSYYYIYVSIIERRLARDDTGCKDLIYVKTE